MLANVSEQTRLNKFSKSIQCFKFGWPGGFWWISWGALLANIKKRFKSFGSKKP